MLKIVFLMLLTFSTAYSSETKQVDINYAGSSFCQMVRRSFTFLKQRSKLEYTLASCEMTNDRWGSSNTYTVNVVGQEYPPSQDDQYKILNFEISNMQKESISPRILSPILEKFNIKVISITGHSYPEYHGGHSRMIIGLPIH